MNYPVSSSIALDKWNKKHKIRRTKHCNRYTPQEQTMSGDLLLSPEEIHLLPPAPQQTCLPSPVPFSSQSPPADNKCGAYILNHRSHSRVSRTNSRKISMLHKHEPQTVKISLIHNVGYSLSIRIDRPKVPRIKAITKIISAVEIIRKTVRSIAV